MNAEEAGTLIAIGNGDEWRQIGGAAELLGDDCAVAGGAWISARPTVAMGCVPVTYRFGRV